MPTSTVSVHELSNRATSACEAARERVAKFLHARAPQEISFTRGTTESINLVAATWALAHLKPGDKILLSELEHRTNLVLWQMIAKRTGAVLDYILVTGDAGTLDPSRIDGNWSAQFGIFPSASIGRFAAVRESSFRCFSLLPRKT